MIDEVRVWFKDATKKWVVQINRDQKMFFYNIRLIGYWHSQVSDKARLVSDGETEAWMDMDGTFNIESKVFVEEEEEDEEQEEPEGDE
jgi:hypothetical protein